MPDRNTFDESEKFDHSNHSTQRREKGDLSVPGHESGARGADMNEVPGETIKKRPAGGSDEQG